MGLIYDSTIFEMCKSWNGLTDNDRSMIFDAISHSEKDKESGDLLWRRASRYSNDAESLLIDMHNALSQTEGMDYPNNAPAMLFALSNSDGRQSTILMLELMGKWMNRPYIADWAAKAIEVKCLRNAETAKTAVDRILKIVEYATGGLGYNSVVRNHPEEKIYHENMSIAICRAISLVGKFGDGEDAAKLGKILSANGRYMNQYMKDYAKDALREIKERASPPHLELDKKKAQPQVVGSKTIRKSTIKKN